MTYENKYNYIVLLSLFLCSCGVNWDNIPGTGKAETINDSVKQVLKFDSGLVIDSFGEKKGKIEGLRFSFDKEAGHRIYSKYENGKRNGKEIAFYQNGKIVYTSFYRNDTTIGETYFYYDSGNLQTFEYYYPKSGQLVFQVKYNEVGNIKTVKGSPLIQYNRNKDTVKINEEYYGECEYVQPNNYSMDVNAFEFRKDSLDIKPIKLIQTRNFWTFKEKFKKNGKVNILLKWNLKDTISGTVFNGKDIITLFVAQ